MNKDGKTALLPNLRFPEYFNKRDWRHDFLGHISIILRGGSPRPIEEYLTNESSGLNWLKIGDVDKGSKYITHTSEKVIKQALTKTREVSPGDLIMSNSMSFGRPYISKIKTCIHDGWIAVTESNENINTDYLYYFILSDGSQKYFIRAAAGGGIKNLNAEIIKMLPVQFPCDKEEQQKIADCLSSLDDLIAVEDKKLSALRDHKKALMQKLFPAEGETVPKWRFPEFRDSGEWELHTIRNTCNSYSGGTPDTAEKDYYGGKIPFIRSAEIDKNATELYLTEEGLKNSSAKMVAAGDVLVALYGANSGDVALSKINGAINQAILCLKHESNNAFIYHYLSHKKQWIIKTYIQGGQGNLSGEIIKSVGLCFPKLPEEQQKIADCLSALDNIITAQSEKIEALKAHKKGLMQGLFPSIEEVDA